ncbi:hypothetical protein J4Q44_G00360610 [Coregonus suidteri]|uniref:Uncharacterized protein n=1 Tax=Coregonus suidteri TaxID=861788 RepID=A0AAN8Q7B9_9TELE
MQATSEQGNATTDEVALRRTHFVHETLRTKSPPIIEIVLQLAVLLQQGRRRGGLHQDSAFFSSSDWLRAVCRLLRSEVHCEIVDWA